jgi:hypothetical protein
VVELELVPLLLPQAESITSHAPAATAKARKVIAETLGPLRIGRQRDSLSGAKTKPLTKSAIGALLEDSASPSPKNLCQPTSKLDRDERLTRIR